MGTGRAHADVLYPRDRNTRAGSVRGPVVPALPVLIGEASRGGACDFRMPGVVLFDARARRKYVFGQLACWASARRNDCYPLAVADFYVRDVHSQYLATSGRSARCDQRCADRFANVL